MTLRRYSGILKVKHSIQAKAILTTHLHLLKGYNATKFLRDFLDKDFQQQRFLVRIDRIVFTECHVYNTCIAVSDISTSVKLSFRSYIAHIDIITVFVNKNEVIAETIHTVHLTAQNLLKL